MLVATTYAAMRRRFSDPGSLPLFSSDLDTFHRVFRKKKTPTHDSPPSTDATHEFSLPAAARRAFMHHQKVQRMRCMCLHSIHAYMGQPSSTLLMSFATSSSMLMAHHLWLLIGVDQFRSNWLCNIFTDLIVSRLGFGDFWPVLKVYQSVESIVCIIFSISTLEVLVSSFLFSDLPFLTH